MARGDFRYTPRYQFWATIVAMIICGVAIAWFLGHNQIDETISLLPGSLIALAVVIWLNRSGGFSQPPHHVEPYDHPILGLYAGLAAAFTLLLLDESLLYALIVAVIFGTILSIATVGWRRWRTRNDPPTQHRPVPTLTGWR